MFQIQTLYSNNLVLEYSIWNAHPRLQHAVPLESKRPNISLGLVRAAPGLKSLASGSASTCACEAVLRAHVKIVAVSSLFRRIQVRSKSQKVVYSVNGIFFRCTLLFLIWFGPKIRLRKIIRHSYNKFEETKYLPCCLPWQVAKVFSHSTTASLFFFTQTLIRANPHQFENAHP